MKVNCENIVLKGDFDISAKLCIPDGASKAVVISHSFRNDMEEVACSDAFLKFVSLGYAVMSIDFVGHGKSEGGLENFSLSLISENVSCAVKYLRDKGFDKVGYYAISLGVLAGILSDDHLDCQVFLSPTPLYDLTGPLQRYAKQLEEQRGELSSLGYAVVSSSSGRGDFRIGKTFVGEITNDRGKIKEKHKLSDVPTLLIQPSLDKKSVFGKSCAKYCGDKYFLVDGANHNFTDVVHRKIAINEAVNFFNDNL